MGLMFMGFILLALENNVLRRHIYTGLANNIRGRQMRRITGRNCYATFRGAEDRPDLRLGLAFVIILHLLCTNHDSKAGPQYARRFDLRVGRSLVILHIRRRRHIPSCRNGYIILSGNSSRCHIHILYSPYLYRLSRNRRAKDPLMIVMGADGRRRTRQ